MQTLQTKVDENANMALLEIMTFAKVNLKSLVSDSNWSVHLEVKEKIISLKAKIKHMKKGDQIPKKGSKKKYKNENPEKKVKNLRIV
jgi:hypothetical protein